MKTSILTLAIALAFSSGATSAAALDDLAKCRVYNAKIKMNYAKCLELDKLLVEKGKAPKGICESKRTTSLDKATAKFVDKLGVSAEDCGIDSATTDEAQALQLLASSDDPLTTEQEAALAGTAADITSDNQSVCEDAGGTWDSGVCTASASCDCYLDACGVPTGDGSSCADACGVPNGDDSSCADACGVPNGDDSSCADSCGVPNGDHTSCIYTTPKLDLGTGVLSTTNMVSSATLTSTPPSTDRCSSNSLDVNPFDADLSAADAGDSINIITSVQNLGTGAAAQVQLATTVPQEFGPPRNFRYKFCDSSGFASFSSTANQSAGQDIDLLFPFDIPSYHPTSGRNVVLIVYSVSLPQTIGYLESNATGLELDFYTGRNYSGHISGIDYTGVYDDVLESDDVSIDTAGPSLTNTSVPDQVAVGTIRDTLDYQLVVTVPAGTQRGLIVSQSLPAALAYISEPVVTPDSSLVVHNITPQIVNNGTEMSLTFGDIYNPGDASDNPRTITVDISAVILNNSSAKGNREFQTAAELGGTLAPPIVATSKKATIEEPRLQATFAQPPIAEGGDDVVFSVVIGHRGDSRDAHEIDFDFTLPPGVSNLRAESSTSGVAPDTIVKTGDSLSLFWTTLLVGETSTIEFTGTVDPDSNGGAVLDLEGVTKWTGQPTDLSTNELSIYNIDSVERTGGAGAVNDYIRTDRVPTD